MKTRILGLLAVGLLAGSMAAQAVTISGSYTFSGSDFVPVVGSSSAPYDPVAGSFTITFDNSSDTDNSTSGLTASISVPMGAIGYTYWQGSDTLIIGGVLNGVTNIISGSNDFFLGISSFSTSPIFSYLWYSSQTSPDMNFLALTVTGAAAAPEPGTLALLGLGLAGLGLSRRRKA